MDKQVKTYSPMELMEVLHLGRTSIYRMLRCGEIRASRVGNKKFVITQAEVDRLLTPQEDIRLKRKRRKSS